MRYKAWLRYWPQVLFGFLIAVLVFELVRDTGRWGDFKGYVDTGGYVLEGGDVYRHPAVNTWPPFFSIVCVPLALAARVSEPLTRFVWLAGMLVALWATVRLIGRMLYRRDLPPWTPALLLPTLFIVRMFLETMALLQKNAYLLLLCVAAVWLWHQRREAWAGMCLALAISVKVYPVFILAFFVARLQWRVNAYTILFCVLFAVVPFAAFGVTEAAGYYEIWGHQAFVRPIDFIFRNQSLLATLTRLFSDTEVSRLDHPLGPDYFINVASLSRDAVKRFMYIVVALVAAGVLWLFRRPLRRPVTEGGLLEIGLAFGLCAVLSPLVWKAYGIFWLPALMAIYPYLYRVPGTETPIVPDEAHRTSLRWAYFLGWGLMTFSSELFIGRHLSYVAQAYGAMPLGGIILAGLCVCLRVGRFATPALRVPG